MVGIEAHLERLQSMLHLDYDDGAMIVGISGPAGIGKTTIARALHRRLSCNFQLTCFMKNIKGSYNHGLDEYGLKLRLQEQLLSKILNENGIRIYHLGAIRERLCDQKVLIILDDVDDLQQLEALANETNWFGRGSRILVTTEDQEILEQHSMNNIYHVGFPNEEEARKMFCRYAFNQSSTPDGFESLVERVKKVCSNLPMGLRFMGSSLRRKNIEDWEYILNKLETSLDPKIEGVLRLGYDNLHKDDQFLFLLIAFFFNNKDENHVMVMLADSLLNVRYGLKTLADKSLIQISTKGKIVMHKLLQQVGREVVERQDPRRRQILINADEIRNVLENNCGSTSVRDIYFDISTISKDVHISARAFKKMCNLQFLSIFNTRRDTNVRVHVSEDMDFPPRLRFLRWEAYPGKCLPPTFKPEYLVRLVLRHNKLKKLWEGSQALTNLKKMDLYWSLDLKELPDLSSATSLEKLDLTSCKSLVEIPTSVGNLRKLEELEMDLCINLQVVPTLINLAYLQRVWMMGCRKLRKIPDFSRNIKSLRIADTMLEELPESIRHWSGLASLTIYGSVHPYPLVTEPFLEGSGADIERLPDWIKDLHGLTELCIGGCPKLLSLPELPGLLTTLQVDSCESLETLISFPINSQIEYLSFPNCFKLSEEDAMRVITQRSLETCLPGKDIPAEFIHQGIGDSFTIPSSFCKFRICLVVSPKPHRQSLYTEVSCCFFDLLCHIRINGSITEENILRRLPHIQAEHLFIFPYQLLKDDDWFELNRDNQIALEFSTSSEDIEVIKIGLRPLEEESSEDDDDSLSDRRNVCDAPKESFFESYAMFLSLIFLFLLSLIFLIFKET
ncbi:hypothetical protein AALP_AA3G061300 [Arabis alpina]|uniref:AAA+ ATPase domain-containing protein n=1 Tax=Arabis alpina TaxID=50452 RepID=A0A087H7C8_ARAAL|nr:hypothetical protein AALP_AA3G061300 [Arabis alpina]